MILISWARGRITESLSCEILEMICEKFEGVTPEDVSRENADRFFASHPVPRPEEEADRASFDILPESHMETWSDIPLEKHKRNKLILSMSHVCRSWRVHMIGLKRIWREIAFDIETEPASVHLATFFLAMIENDNIPIQIYARFASGGYPIPILESLLSKLREQTHRWETFLYWGRLGPCYSYLDLPAPLLRKFSDNHDLSHLYSGQTTQFFTGYVPSLRSLVTSALGSWHPATLTRLKTLDLWDCNPGPSIGSLLDFLRRTPQLEEINIVSPNPLVHDCSPAEVVNLLHLKEIKVQNPDFYSIIGHLAIPNVRVVAVYSIHTRGASGPQVRPAFRARHPFVEFASMGTPLLNHAVVVASIHVQKVLSGLMFTISLVTEKKTSFCVSLQWACGVNIDDQMEYIERSITALARMDFRPGATLQVRTDGCKIDHSPLLHFGAVEYLLVECQDSTEILEVLSRYQASSLPNLKTLFAPDIELDEKTIESLSNLLQSRRNLLAVFYADNYGDLVRMLGDRFVVGGEFVSLEMALP